MAQSKMSEVLQRRELTGKALVTLGLVGAAVAMGLYFSSLIVPWLLDLATNTLKLGLTCAAIAALGYVFFNPKTRMLITYGYASFVRFLTMRFTELDPIGILNTYVSRLKERLESMDEAIGSLNGHVKQLSDVIDQNEQKRKNAMSRAEQAHKIAERGGEQADVMRAETAAASHAAGRLADSNKRLTKSLTQGEGLLRNLRKLRGLLRRGNPDAQRVCKRRGVQRPERIQVGHVITGVERGADPCLIDQISDRHTLVDRGR